MVEASFTDGNQVIVKMELWASMKRTRSFLVNELKFHEMKLKKYSQIVVQDKIEYR